MVLEGRPTGVAIDERGFGSIGTPETSGLRRARGMKTAKCMASGVSGRRLAGRQGHHYGDVRGVGSMRTAMCGAAAAS